MTELLNASKILNLPDGLYLNTKITKKVILESADLTPMEKKLISNDIEKLIWLATLKPTNSNLNDYTDNLVSYEEVNFIEVYLKEQKNYQKIAQLLQKIIPYHMILWLQNEDGFCIYTAFKQINQADSTKRTIQELIHTPWINKIDEISELFLNSLDFQSLSHHSLKTYYEDFVSQIYALQSAKITGVFRKQEFHKTFEEVPLLREIESLEGQIVTLKITLKKQTQIKRKVELNMQIKRLYFQLTELQETLTKNNPNPKGVS